MGLTDLFDRNALVAAIIKDTLTPEQRAELVAAFVSMAEDRKANARSWAEIATALKGLEREVRSAVLELQRISGSVRRQ